MSNESNRDSVRMPVVFVGHGSPMNVVEDNRWTRAFTALGQALPRPQAILAISAHWETRGTYLTGDVKPATIHDFSGFPRALYEIQYPAPGHVPLASRVVQLVADERAGLRTDWGLDHGTWTVLHWMYPEADIPVVQLSLDRRLTLQQHHDLARSLRALRTEGVLILGSGNIVHNLGDAFERMRSARAGGEAQTPVWAARFDTDIARALTDRDPARMLKLARSDDGRLAHPTAEHFLPLIYTQAATDDDDPIHFTSTGFDWGSLAMRNVIFGASAVTDAS